MYFYVPPANVLSCRGRFSRRTFYQFENNHELQTQATQIVLVWFERRQMKVNLENICSGRCLKYTHIDNTSMAFVPISQMIFYIPIISSAKRITQLNHIMVVWDSSGFCNTYVISITYYEEYYVCFFFLLKSFNFCQQNINNLSAINLMVHYNEATPPTVGSTTPKNKKP